MISSLNCVPPRGCQAPPRGKLTPESRNEVRTMSEAALDFWTSCGLRSDTHWALSSDVIKLEQVRANPCCAVFVMTFLRCRRPCVMRLAKFPILVKITLYFVIIVCLKIRSNSSDEKDDFFLTNLCHYNTWKLFSHRRVCFRRWCVQNVQDFSKFANLPGKFAELHKQKWKPAVLYVIKLMIFSTVWLYQQKGELGYMAVAVASQPKRVTLGHYHWKSGKRSSLIASRGVTTDIESLVLRSPTGNVSVCKMMRSEIKCDRSKFLCFCCTL